jgi:porphobilinogen synthase
MMLIRPRRNRRTPSIRGLVRENQVKAGDFIYPLFIVEGEKQKQEIASMPGVYRWSPDLLIEHAKEAFGLGILSVALFPCLDSKLKDSRAKESINPKGLLQRTVRALKEACPELCVITDVAMDPYSSDGHDGLVEKGKILNDPSLEILSQMAVSQAKAGADLVAPSDMMDGRVKAIREALDQDGFQDVGILSYSAKYASGFYGPFREALDSAPKSGDKKTYQMDPANSKEALREVLLDIEEGADMVMVKPAMPYLDVIREVKERVDVPVAAYQVSGEYAMIQCAAEKAYLDLHSARDESLLSIKRAGADIILSYFAFDYCKDTDERS